MTGGRVPCGGAGSWGSRSCPGPAPPSPPGDPGGGVPLTQQEDRKAAEVAPGDGAEGAPVLHSGEVEDHGDAGDEEDVERAQHGQEQGGLSERGAAQDQLEQHLRGTHSAQGRPAPWAGPGHCGAACAAGRWGTGGPTGASACALLFLCSPLQPPPACELPRQTGQRGAGTSVPVDRVSPIHTPSAHSRPSTAERGLLTLLHGAGAGGGSEWRWGVTALAGKRFREGDDDLRVPVCGQLTEDEEVSGFTSPDRD